MKNIQTRQRAFKFTATGAVIGAVGGVILGISVHDGFFVLMGAMLGAIMFGSLGYAMSTMDPSDRYNPSIPPYRKPDINPPSSNSVRRSYDNLKQEIEQHHHPPHRPHL